MPRILLIDDDPILIKLLQTKLSKAGYSIVSASNGLDGLRKARSENPDLVILDVMMPGIDGFEVASRIRNTPETKRMLILMLTATSDASSKVLAFSIGVDDYLTKPFDTSKLVARVSSLLSRADQVKDVSFNEIAEGRLIAVHSLRGGLGCSSLAINLSIGLYNLWSRPTILLDNVFTSGQIALLLDTPVHQTWADFSEKSKMASNEDLLYSCITAHGSGLHFLAAPSDPIEADVVDQFAVHAATSILRERYDYVVADLQHDFSNRTLEVLESADRVLLVLSPDIVSVRLAAMTLRIYNQLDFHNDKAHLVLAQASAHSSLAVREIEQALHKKISYIIPYDPKVANRAVASGIPYICRNPKIPLSSAIEDLAYFSSKQSDRETPPPKPSSSWKRVSSRHASMSRKNQIGRLGLPLLGKLGDSTS